MSCLLFPDMVAANIQHFGNLLEGAKGFDFCELHARSQPLNLLLEDSDATLFLSDLEPSGALLQGAQPTFKPAVIIFPALASDIPVALAFRVFVLLFLYSYGHSCAVPGQRTRDGEREGEREQVRREIYYVARYIFV